MGCAEGKPIIHHQEKSDLLKDISQISVRIAQNNQVHLIQHQNLIQEENIEDFYESLRLINFEQTSEMYRKYLKGEYNEKFDASQFSAIPEVLSLKDRNQELTQKYLELGYKCISERKVGIIVMAAGQGSRLKFDKPQGFYKPGLPSDKSLFHFYMAKVISLVRHVNETCGSSHSFLQPTIPIFIMTSPENDQEIQEYFEKNVYFGVPAEWFVFFQQENIPALDNQGKIILKATEIPQENLENASQKEGKENESVIKQITNESQKIQSKYKIQIMKNPNGNGGIYDAIRDAGIQEKCEKLGVKYLQVMNIDNILTKIADPFTIGYMEDKNLEIAVKSIKKRNAEERVGVLLNYDNQFQVIEYSDMNAEIKKQTNSSGELQYGEGYSGSFFFRVDFLNEVFKLQNIDVWRKYHIAKQSSSIISPNTGSVMVPEKGVSNVLQFELFIFDTFPLCKSLGIVEIDREEQFAPIKNHQDDSVDDNPITARQLLFKLHRKWVEKSGLEFVQDATQEPVCEVDASVSYDGENLEHALKQIKESQAKVEFPLYVI